LPRKTVAIRGLDTELYHEVFSMAKKDGKRVSELMNNALEVFLNGGAENNPSIYTRGNGKSSDIFTLKNEGDISLGKKDIKSLSDEVGAFRIETSGRLTFEKDMDKATLDCIDRVVIHDGTVEVPRSLYPHLLIRSDIFGKIEKY
jgi:hypothetical protein